MIQLKNKLECDVCGKPAIGEAIIEGARVLVCANCAKYGKIVSHPKPRATPLTPFTAPAKTPKEFELVDGYGALIRGARQSLGLSLKELGQKLGIREQELQKMEEEKLKPTEKDCRKLETFLKIKLLLEATPEESPEELAKKLEQIKRQSKPSNAVTLADLVEIKVKKN
ncbi:MAG: helix-turn-helix domain-containing protein [Candidatus Micrarchaeia archaeon]